MAYQFTFNNQTAKLLKRVDPKKIEKTGSDLYLAMFDPVSNKHKGYISTVYKNENIGMFDYQGKFYKINLEKFEGLSARS